MGMKTEEPLFALRAALAATSVSASSAFVLFVSLILQSLNQENE